MNIEISYNVDGPTLVAVRQFFDDYLTNGYNVIFATISPNPNVKVPCTRRWNKHKINCKIPYGKLPQVQQFNYCMRMLKNAYNNSTTTEIFGTWELNKQGNVHFHLLMVDGYIQGQDTLQIFRRDVLNSELVFKNLSKSMIDYCNNIVFVTDSIEARLAYMTKESNSTSFPYFSTSSPIKRVKEGSHWEPWFPLAGLRHETKSSSCHAFPPSDSLPLMTQYIKENFDNTEAVYMKELDRIMYNDIIYINSNDIENVQC